MEKNEKNLYPLEEYWIMFEPHLAKTIGEYFEMKDRKNICNWLYPIKFHPTQAFVIEIMQDNMDYILINREDVLQQISSRVELDLNFFYENLKDIQHLLIQQNKVKVCKDGTVIIMNDI